jgi:hypothetical protein
MTVAASEPHAAHHVFRDHAVTALMALDADIEGNVEKGGRLEFGRYRGLVAGDVAANDSLCL